MYAKRTQHISTQTHAHAMNFNSHYYRQGLRYLRSCSLTSWNIFRYARVCASIYIYWCVFLSEGRIQLSVSYLRSHNDMWNPNSAELLSIPEPQGFSLRWQLSLSFSLSLYLSVSLSLSLSLCESLSSLSFSLCLPSSLFFSSPSLKTVTSSDSKLAESGRYKCGGRDWQSEEVRNRQWLLRRGSLIVAVWLEASRAYQRTAELLAHVVSSKNVKQRTVTMHGITNQH